MYTVLLCIESPGGFRCARPPFKVLPIVQQLNSPLRWSMTCLPERLPPRCLSHWAQRGGIWLEAVITSIFQNELHLMTSSSILNARQCFLVQDSDDAVQQRLCSPTVQRERENMFLKIEQCCKHFTCSWTCMVSSSCDKDSHWIHPKSLCCHFNFTRT